MKKKRIVTVGGGTGSFTLLSGLKKYPLDISAVVAMTDDGGSTGILRDEMGVLPPGDVRQCLAALSESSEKMRELMNYRFEEGKLRGHSFGNLFLSALEKISGSFSAGLDEAMKILSVKGIVLPVVTQDLHLVAECANGKKIVGQNKINHSNLGTVCRVCFSSRAMANSKAVRSALEADMIVIGPGNHYCSVLPNLAVRGFADAIKKGKAKVVYVCNLTNKKGHTFGWDLDDYVESVEKYIGKGRIDEVIFPSEKPDKKLVAKYEKQEGENVLVNFDVAKNPRRNFLVSLKNIISAKEAVYSKADLVSEMRALIRHDSDKLAKAVVESLEGSS